MNRGFVFAALCVMCLATTLVGGCGDDVRCGPPLASAGEDVTDAAVGVDVSLTCSATLPPVDNGTCQEELSSVTFQWEQVTGPEDVTLAGADQATASFLPDRPGAYTFRCKAAYPNTSDPDRMESHWDAVNVNVASSGCAAPVARSGNDQLFTTAMGLPVAVDLDGSGSHSDPECPTVTLTSFAWRVVEQPVGADVTIENADVAQAALEISVVGVYVIELEVSDSVGGYDTDRVQISLVEHTGCEDTLDVTVTDTRGDPIAGAEVTVVDMGGASHAASTDAAGLATFNGLADGQRRSITASSTETVDALPGSGDPNPRPRFERLTVLDICTASLTLPLRETASGRAARPRGLVTAKVPASIFAMVPHSMQCVGDCTWDADCPPGYFCEHEATACQDLCTPRALLPFFGIQASDRISGQFQAALLVPATPVDNLSATRMEEIFAPRARGGPLPGNLVTNDAFFNSSAHILGLDVWGNPCDTTADCGDPAAFNCEVGPGDVMTCRDRSPLTNLRAQVPAGDGSSLFLVLGIIDVSIVDLLQVLTPFYIGAEPLDPAAMLATFKMQTVRVCPLSADIPADGEVDVSAALAGLRHQDCWNLTLEQEEVVEPAAYPIDLIPGNACTTDADCGWPDSGKKCLADPASPADTYCLTPMFRVRLTSPDQVELIPDLSAFDPTSPDADPRLCAWLPDEAYYEIMCDRGTSIPEPCDPPDYCELPVEPGATDCAFRYGLSFTAIDFPIQHPTLPEGGRVVTGFRFNVTPYRVETNPVFLVPPISLQPLQGASMSAAQVYTRNLVDAPGGNIRTLPGRLGASARSRAVTHEMLLPAPVSVPRPDSPDDAGIEVRVYFDPEDPLVECASVQLERTQAAAIGLAAPQAGSHALPASFSDGALPVGLLREIVLSRVDRVGGLAIEDPVWRIYAPPTTQTLALPSTGDAFAAGTEVWLSLAGADFTEPFEYDLFSAELLVSGQTLHASDSFAVIHP